MYKIHKLFPYYYQEVLEMAQKKYRPGMNCEKTGKYTCYDKDGNEIDSAPHAVMPLFLKIPFVAKKGDMVRKAK